MDLSSNYRSIAKKYFPNALIVSDRFHVIRLVLDSFIKIAYSLDKELKKQFGLGRLLRKKRETLDDWQQSKIYMYLNKQPVLKQLYNITPELMNLFNENVVILRIVRKG